VRKLLLRFSPVLWEDDPKASKISPLVNSLEEELDEVSSFEAANEVGDDKEVPVKLIEGIKKDAVKLEAEGMGETIPIAQLRRAAFWCRLAPSGREKLLVIENADRMQEEGRNSLLKLLEEPSARLRIVLTSVRPGSLLQTILSRVRPYRFNARGEAVEADVIKRVFRDKESGSREQGVGSSATPGIASYLDSFLPVSADTLEALASYFAASVAHKAAILAKRSHRTLSDELVLLGKYSAPKAEAAGLGRPKDDSAPVVAVILEKADKFELRSLFSRFLYYLLENVSLSQRTDAAPSFIPSITYHEIWAKSCNWAESAVGTYNLRPAQVLEKLFTDLSRGMAEL
jgi:DNA polymerase-3 subunit gamma/tau